VPAAGRSYSIPRPCVAPFITVRSSETKGEPMSEPTPAVQLLLTPPQAAKALAIGQRKLWELTNRGIIRATRIGRSVRYDLRDLTAFVERAKKGGAQ
jgi:excisionase family DNA binding protein